MNKLSNKSIEKFKIFLNDEKFSYISLTRHEFKILFSIYNNVISLINETETKEERLIKHLEHKIKIYENRVMENGFDDDLLRLNTYQDILEKVKEW